MRRQRCRYPPLEGEEAGEPWLLTLVENGTTLHSDAGDVVGYADVLSFESFEGGRWVPVDHWVDGSMGPLRGRADSAAPLGSGSESRTPVYGLVAADVEDISSVVATAPDGETVTLEVHSVEDRGFVVFVGFVAATEGDAEVTVLDADGEPVHGSWHVTLGGFPNW